MKRIICAILSLIFAVSVFFNMSICVNGVSPDEKDAFEFAEGIGKMLENADISSDIASAGKSLKNENNEFETCRLIVKTAGKLNTLNAVSYVNGFDNLWILQFDSIESTCSAFEFYSKQNYVDFVETDKIVSAADTGDFFLPTTISEKTYLSWGPEFLGFDHFNKSLIDSGKPLANITVAVIDSGVESNHEFLKGRVIPTNINTSVSGERNSSEDDYGHGTQVAGIIVDSTLDNIKIKPYKVLDSYGHGTLISLAAGINCAINDGVDVINISLGFNETSSFLEKTINTALASDITVVAAAGNNATDAPFYPSSYSGVIRVSAINNSGFLANYSNYGNITFAAPGHNIKTSSIGNNYVLAKGTSFAAPFCSASAACLKSLLPYASSEDIFDIIKTNAVRPISENSENEMGFGIIYALQVFEESLSGKVDTPEIFSYSNLTSISISPIRIGMSCQTPDSVIYYTTDGSVPHLYNPNAKIYDGNPIDISESCIIYAVASAEGKYRSAVTGYKAVIAPNIPQDELVINSEGIITEYIGNASSVSIPRKVNSITVKGIGDNVFKGKDVKVIVCSSNVVSFGNSTFEDCRSLETVYAQSIASVGECCFKNCVVADTFNFKNLNSIGKAAFENVCSTAYKLYGLSFFLNLENLSSIPENAFKDSAISEVECKNISFVGKNAFSGCNALVSAEFKCNSNLPESCFKGCSSLRNVSITGQQAVPSNCFKDCSMLTNVNLPNVILLMSDCFNNCTKLDSVTLPSVISMYSNAFSGCNSLREINLPALEYFEDSSSSTPAFSSSLEAFSAPKLKKTFSDMFSSANNISIIHLNGATDIAEYTFRGCNNIFYLNLENVTSLKENALSDCSASFIDLSNLKTAKNLPNNSGIMLSNEFIESTGEAENLTLYSTPNSFIERYAQYKGYQFIPLPIITNKIPENITSSSEIINVSAVGYGLEYQWYKNTENSTEDGEAIEGATSSSYLFTAEDTAPFYYCVVTQNDFGTVSKTTTNIIVKDTTPADYTEYERAVELANSIDKGLYVNTYSLDHALSKKVYGRYACEQSIVDEQTRIILEAIENLEMNVAKRIYLFSSETDLYIFDRIQTVFMILPEGAIYENIEWKSSNSKAFTVNNAGFVRCVGNGNATITATVHNPDGSTCTASLEFEKKLLGFEKVLSFLFRWFFILLSKIPVKIP